MDHKKYAPIAVTKSFYQIGTPNYPAYLTLGDDGMIIEGGTGATYPILVEQIEGLGIKPERIKYLALTHTHPDHIGAVPNLTRRWPHLKVVAGEVATRLLQNEEVVKEFSRVDGVITEILMIKGDIDEWPPETVDPKFPIDRVLKDGDTIDLGAGVTWRMYQTPGHSSCHVSYYNQGEGIVIIADATGLYNAQKDLFWPNYFDSLESYCASMRKLALLGASIGALSHNGIVRDATGHVRKAVKATEDYHNRMLERVAKGEDPKKVALDLARWVYTFTNLQPFEVIFGLARLMMKRSQAAAGKEGLFKI